MKINENLPITVSGHVLIQDSVTGEILVNEHNDVHPQNMALVIARALARDSNGSIFRMYFGNGGTFYNSSGTIVYRPPNTIGAADLYNKTYFIDVDEQSVGTPESNSVIASPSPSPAITSLVTITAQLKANEPAGQASSDNITTDPNSPYIFDEVGLKSEDGLLLSHLIFSPFEKTGNRAFKITYNLTISVS
jgi:hypothetical protein